MAMTVHCDIVSAEEELFSGLVEMVIAHGHLGDLGILPGHTPLLAVLAAGEVGIHTGSGRSTATVDGGFMSVDHDRVTIVSEQVSADGLS